MSTKNRIGGLMVASVLVVTSFAQGAFAEDNLITENGTESNNTIDTMSSNELTVEQSNTNDQTVTLTVNNNSGNNEASGNTGGGGNITTGDATSDMTLDIGGASNNASLTLCGCPSDNGGLNEISLNGSNSTSNIIKTKTNTTSTTQTNNSTQSVSGTVGNDSGNNSANNNTGSGSGTIGSGNARTQNLQLRLRGARNRLNVTPTVTPAAAGLTFTQ